MPDTPSRDVTRLLREWGEGNAEAMDDLLPLVYGELRRLARHYLRGERPDHTLQPTALVHEAYLKLLGQGPMAWQDRAHFIGVAATLMRRILVDHARAHRAEKRGGGATKLTLDDSVSFFQQRDVDLVTLDEALAHLAEIDPQQSRVVELRFFGGLTIEETAVALRVSPMTVKREWNMAKAWLHQELMAQ